MQQNQRCTICEREPDELLILACHHNLCLGCASQIFILNHNNNPFICQICLMETILDQQTILHFLNITQRNWNKQGKKCKKYPLPPKIKSPEKKLQNIKSYCQTHKQPSLYYCFNCNSIDICSQCILTPKHSTHKMITLKKAIQNNEKRIQQQIKLNLQLKNQLLQQKDKYIQNKKQISQCFGHKKSQIKHVFDEIARTISERFSQLSAIIDEQCLRVQQLYDAYISEISDKQRIVEQSIKIQRQTLQQHSQTNFIQMIGGWSQNKNIFIPNLPTQMPSCCIQFTNCDHVLFEISQLVMQIKLIKEFDEKFVQESVIKMDIMQDQHPKTTIRDNSYRKNTNPSKIQNRLTSSRKLDLSRSIENAAHIINRLQERSAKAV